LAPPAGRIKRAPPYYYGLPGDGHIGRIEP